MAVSPSLIRLTVAAAALLFAAALSADAQMAGKPYRIGFLSLYAGCPIRAEIMDPLRQGLRAHGYIEGQNIIIECQAAPEASDRLPALAAELVRLRVDVILALGTPSAQAAKQATKTIPIVMVYASDPVESALVTSLARPGGNITGLSVLTADLAPKALQILKEAAPSVSRVALLMDPTNPGQTLADRQMDAAAKILGITLRRFDGRTAANLDASFAAALSQRQEGLLVFPLPNVPRIAQLGIKNRLPTIAFLPQHVREGILMCYGPNPAEQYYRAGAYIANILKGAKPGDLPVQLPTKFEMVINLKTAKALGMTIAPSLLLRADQIIE